MKRFYREGNKGGDYLALEVQDDGRVFIEVGHCCAVQVRKIVPVEILTSVLAQALTHPDPAQWEMDWDSTFDDSEYANKLRGMVSTPDNPFSVSQMFAREKHEAKTAKAKQPHTRPSHRQPGGGARTGENEMSFQVRHKEWGVFQGQFLGLDFWHPMSDQPEQGYCEFPTEDEAKDFCGTLKTVPPDMLYIEPFNKLESDALIASQEPLGGQQ